MLESMESKQEETRSIDVTGLPEGAVQALESLVAVLLHQANGSGVHRSPQEWCKALREWAESHRRLDNPADWTRDAIYGRRGE
jgi:hypothetical protein